ncbi:MAG: hypothetical protein DHS20C14_07090 [Phycisphaeraceae bacterium]|nr:MAG: hypothetical protein DHS20C14_07090 [Phycisphaeraceae bacterium]
MLVGTAAVLTLTPAPAAASSHSDAPRIKQDPLVNLTDVYAFVGTRYDDPGQQVLNVVVNVRPFSEPGDGPHYEKFSADARYNIHIADPATGESLRTYEFRFSGASDNIKNDSTILSYGLGTAAGPIMTINDAQQNFAQFYDVIRRGSEPTAVLVNDALVAPPNVGANVTPLYNDADGRAISGAASLAELDSYTAQAITDATTGEVFFAGPREDSFFADVPGTFDLLNVRILDNNGSLADGLGQDGNGVDGFKGFNVLTFAVQIPLTDLPQLPYNDAFFGAQMGIGVYASVSRPRFTVIQNDGSTDTSGDSMQVNRLGNPLFNEVLVALADKDFYNVTDPEDDAQFSSYAENPEIAGLINFVYGTGFATSGRTDLAAVFIPDVLRVATTTGPVPLAGDPGFSRFGFAGGDTTGGVSSGWPNGRRLGDDVIDIALTAVASGPTYDPLTVVGDNVPENDAKYNRVFPYAATPNSGTFNRKDGPLTQLEIADINRDGLLNVDDIQLFVDAFLGASGG